MRPRLAALTSFFSAGINHQSPLNTAKYIHAGAWKERGRAGLQGGGLAVAAPGSGLARDITVRKPGSEHTPNINEMYGNKDDARKTTCVTMGNVRWPSLVPGPR
jgi:hypothetical protein